ncbi:MAG: hypothetical protein Q9170_005921 [Blastenia crenularia]
MVPWGTMSSHQPHLLSLPPEIRNLIYDAVLDLGTPAPVAPGRFIYLDEYIYVGYSVFIPNQVPDASSAAFFCCNHQIRSELSQQILQKVLRYSLSILLQGTDDATHEPEQVIPTWTKIPAPFFTNHPKSVLHVCLQARNARSLSWINEDKGSGRTGLALLNLLRRFFAYGPAFDERAKATSPPRFVEELVIEVLPVKLPASELARGTLTDPQPRIVRGLKLLCPVAYSGLLAGKVGKISLRVDSETAE